MNLSSIKKRIKLLLAGVSSQKIIDRINSYDNNTRAILIGGPVHTNIGDHIIAMQCYEYVKSLGFTTIVEVPEFVYQIFAKKIHINENDYIFICGGGWIGDLYPEEEDVIEKIFERYKNNKIIVLPQTIYFNDIVNSDKLRGLINNVNNCIITVREENSYRFLVDILGVEKEKCMLLPDIALTYPLYMDHSIKAERIGIIFRNDREKNNKQLKDSILRLLRNMNKEYTETDTISKGKFIGIRNRKKVIADKIIEFSGYSLVITDRLHAMVFSYLARTKCIAFDNTTHKVEGVFRKWLDDSQLIHLCVPESHCDVQYIRDILNENEPINIRDFRQEFSKLSERIEKWMKE